MERSRSRAAPSGPSGALTAAGALQALNEALPKIAGGRGRGLELELVKNWESTWRIFGGLEDFFNGNFMEYPLVTWLFNIAMENGPFMDDFPTKTCIYKGYSMAMLNNQMVMWNNHKNIP